MEFRTHFNIEPGEPKIDYSSSIFLVGSCFVNNIGEKLVESKFNSLRNPFGILYHPAAIENFVSRVVREAFYNEEEVFYHNERWHCFEAHSVLSNTIREDLVRELNKNLKISGNFIKRATHIIITLGTSFGYKLRETGSYVANCHKVPQARFEKELMPVEEVKKRLQKILDLLQDFNPGATIIFTISPVRHIKDGVVGNQRSKSHLLAAVGDLETNETARCTYFPSYEIMMDDLRDYRFYREDMIHPNPVAIDYIWNKFKESWLSREAGRVMQEIISIEQGLNHRPFNAESDAHRRFLITLNERIEKLKKTYPQLEF